MVSLPGEWWGFVVFGVCAGILSGLLGVGSGTIIIPALVLFWGFGQKSAQGTALAIMVPMALIGALRYWQNPEVELNGLIIALMSLGAVAGTIGGTELAARLPADLLRRFFAIFLAVVAVQMFFAPPPPKIPASGSADVKMVNPGDKSEAAGQQ